MFLTGLLPGHVRAPTWTLCHTSRFWIYIELPHLKATFAHGILFWSWDGSKTAIIALTLGSPKLRHKRQEQTCVSLRGTWRIHLSSLYSSPNLQSLDLKSSQPGSQPGWIIWCWASFLLISQKAVLSLTLCKKILNQLLQQKLAAIISSKLEREKKNVRILSGGSKSHSTFYTEVILASERLNVTAINWQARIRMYNPAFFPWEYTALGNWSVPSNRHSVPQEVPLALIILCYYKSNLAPVPV